MYRAKIDAVEYYQRSGVELRSHFSLNALLLYEKVIERFHANDEAGFLRGQVEKNVLDFDLFIFSTASEMLGDKVLSLKTRISVFEQTCKQMLEDIQERLVYRTQMYIKSDIVGYAPVAGDLAYPEKLIMMREIAQSLSKEQAEQKAGENRNHYE